jgi:hypothetical protein
MIMIKFSTIGVQSINPGKSTKEVFVDIKYDNGSSKRFSEKIKYGSFFVFFDQTFLSNIGWVSFFEDNEVFHIPPAEKEEIMREKYKLYPELNPAKKVKTKVEDFTEKDFSILDLKSVALDDFLNSAFI